MMDMLADDELYRRPWTEAEENTMVAAHVQFGNKWSQVVKTLPGRTENQSKNHWHSTVRGKNIARASRLLLEYARAVAAVCDDPVARRAALEVAQERARLFFQEQEQNAHKERQQEEQEQQQEPQQQQQQQQQQLLQEQATAIKASGLGDVHAAVASHGVGAEPLAGGSAACHTSCKHAHAAGTASSDGGSPAAPCKPVAPAVARVLTFTRPAPRPAPTGAVTAAGAAAATALHVGVVHVQRCDFTAAPAGGSGGGGGAPVTPPSPPFAATAAAAAAAAAVGARGSGTGSRAASMVAAVETWSPFCAAAAAAVYGSQATLATVQATATRTRHDLIMLHQSHQSNYSSQQSQQDTYYQSCASPGTRTASSVYAPPAPPPPPPADDGTAAAALDTAVMNAAGPQPNHHQRRFDALDALLDQIDAMDASVLAGMGPESDSAVAEHGGLLGDGAAMGEWGPPVEPLPLVVVQQPLQQQQLQLQQLMQRPQLTRQQLQQQDRQAFGQQGGLVGQQQAGFPAPLRMASEAAAWAAVSDGASGSHLLPLPAVFNTASCLHVQHQLLPSSRSDSVGGTQPHQHQHQHHSQQWCPTHTSHGASRAQTAAMAPGTPSSASCFDIFEAAAAAEARRGHERQQQQPGRAAARALYCSSAAGTATATFTHSCTLGGATSFLRGGASSTTFSQLLGGGGSTGGLGGGGGMPSRMLGAHGAAAGTYSGSSSFVAPPTKLGAPFATLTGVTLPLATDAACTLGLHESDVREVYMEAGAAGGCEMMEL